MSSAVLIETGHGSICIDLDDQYQVFALMDLCAPNKGVVRLKGMTVLDEDVQIRIKDQAIRIDIYELSGWVKTLSYVKDKEVDQRYPGRWKGGR